MSTMETDVLYKTFLDEISALLTAKNHWKEDNSEYATLLRIVIMLKSIGRIDKARLIMLNFFSEMDKKKIY